MVLVLSLGFFGLLAGVYLFFHGFRVLKRKRWIEDTPTSKIGGAAIGPVKVSGRAAGPYTLLSPLAQVDCLYFRAVAWSGQRVENEETLESRAVESIFTPLFVEDETGRLMIDPRGAELDLPREFEETITGESMSECARRFLRRHGLSTGGDTQVAEYAIKPGDPLLVLGAVVETYAPQDFLSPEAADLQRREQLEAMGMPQSEMPAPSPRAESGFDVHPRVVVARGEHRQPFVLSREFPQRMIDRLSRRAAFEISAGPPLALFGLALVLKFLGIW